MDIYTIGHSTHDQATFTNMLHEHNIELLVDVRSIPFSRRQPWFNQHRLEDAIINGKKQTVHHRHDTIMPKWLHSAEVEYTHLLNLGGRRGKQGIDSPNLGWRNKSFSNYADYALSPAFAQSLQTLMELADKKRVCYMCSERHPSQCHRSIISDYLTALGVNVYHILPNGKSTKLERHQLGKWGAEPHVHGGIVIYPPDVEQLTLF